MQGGRSTSAVEAAKEAAANVGASAWAGKEKTKAVVEGAVDKARTPDPAAKEAAEARKVERIREVEATKRDAISSNAAAKERATSATYHPSPPAQPVGVGGRAVDHAAAPTHATGANSSGVAPGAHAAGAGGGALDSPPVTDSGVAPPGALNQGGAVEGQTGNVPAATTEVAGGDPPATGTEGYTPART